MSLGSSRANDDESKGNAGTDNAATMSAVRSFALRDAPYFLEKYILPFVFLALALQSFGYIFKQRHISRLILAVREAGPFSMGASVHAAAIVLFLTLFVFDLIVLYLLVRQRRPQVDCRGSIDILVPLIATFGYLGVNLTSLMPSVARERFLSPEILRILFLPAFLVTIVGALFAAISLLYLGRSFSIAVQARELKVRGPYRIVRHPMYIGHILMVTAITVLNATFAALAIYLVVVGLTLYRARLEESLLVDTFPPYRDYMRHTGRLVPWIGRVL